MSVRLHPLRAAAALAVASALVLAACGGGGGSDASSSDGSSGTKADPTTTIDAGSLPDFKPDKKEFEEVDGSQARFVNLLPIDGEGADIDVYWGLDAETGKKATTVKYGEVSDWMPMQVEKDPAFTNDDGSQDVNVVFYKAGETDLEGRIQQQAEKLEDDMSLTYNLGWTKPSGDFVPSSLGVSFEHTASEAPDGKAWVAFNSIGIGGIEGGDFMTLNDDTGCQMMTIQGDIDTANNGEAYLLDPGSKTFTASDANTDCSVKTDPVTLDLQAGDRYVIYAYGTTKDDRQLMALKVGE